MESINFPIDHMGAGHGDSECNPFDSVYRRPSAQSPLSPEETEMLVDKVLLTADGTTALVETSQGRHRGWYDKHFTLLPIADTEGLLAAKPLPPDLLSRMAFSLGFLAPDYPVARRRSSAQPTTAKSNTALNTHLLAFLDREFWVCTCALGGEAMVPGRIKRHYLLPGEWWNMDGLEMAVMRRDGALVCPRNGYGDAGVVWGGLGEEWGD